MVGLIPLFAVETLEAEILRRLPGFNRRLKSFLNYRPELAALVSRWQEPGTGERGCCHSPVWKLKRVVEELIFVIPQASSLSVAEKQPANATEKP
jgi:hypothetical protein